MSIYTHAFSADVVEAAKRFDTLVGNSSTMRSLTSTG
jgi:hypothetical protein